MNRRTRSHLPVALSAISNPPVREAARMIKRHGNCAEAGPNDAVGAPANAGTAARPEAGTTERRGRRVTDRKAKVPFAQRTTVDAAKTAMNRTAFVTKIVQKTST